MEARKYQLAIDTTALLIQKVQKAFENWKIVGALFIDVKEGFDYVFWAKLVQKISDLGIDNDLIGKIQFFLIDKWVELVIDGHINPK